MIPSKAAYLFCMSPYKEEFQKPKVREAIAHVLDQDAVGIVVYGGHCETCDSVICGGIKFYEPCRIRTQKDGAVAKRK